MRKLLAPALAVAALLGTVAATSTLATSAPTADQPLRFDADEPQDCLQAYPSRVSASGLTDDGKRISLDVVVILDGVDRETGAARLAHAARSYAPLGIDLKVVRFVKSLVREDADGDPIARDSDAGRESQGIINFAKAQFGGTRPADADIVYVLTDLDIYADGIGNAVAGQADCIGGVAWDDTAFAVGEIGDEFGFGPATLQHEFTSKVFAHELGHLMGAHHHFQECGAPAVGEFLEGGIGPCSLMTNLVDFQAIDFSNVNRLVVRGHAVDFAD